MRWECSACDKKYNTVQEYIQHLKRGKCRVDVDRLFALGIITESECNEIKSTLEKKSA